MNAMAVRLLAGLVLLLAVAAGSYWAGDHNRNNAWLAKQAKVEAAARKQYDAEVKRGEDAAGVYLADATTLRDGFTDLKEKFDGLKNRVSLVVSPAVGAVCGSANPVGPQSSLGTESGSVDGDGRLTTGAVWMWNSALTGSDQPAGACSAVDTSEASCAVATSLALDDAWANHTRNAQLCAEDRLAHQRLIDFVSAKPTPKAQP